MATWTPSRHFYMTSDTSPRTPRTNTAAVRPHAPSSGRPYNWHFKRSVDGGTTWKVISLDTAERLTRRFSPWHGDGRSYARWMLEESPQASEVLTATDGSLIKLVLY